MSNDGSGIKEEDGRKENERIKPCKDKNKWRLCYQGHLLKVCVLSP